MPETSRRRLSVEGTYRIAFDEGEVLYQVKRSSRARQVRLEIKRDAGLVVVLPRSFPLNDLAAILIARRRWICRHLSALSATQTVPSPAGLTIGSTLPYLDGSLTLVCAGAGQREEALYHGGTLAVQRQCIDGKLGSVVERWYRKQARDVFAGKTEHYGKLMGLSHKGITVRGQRTIWGSCSRRRTLSFNWKLLMAPEAVIDYIVIHELAHLKEMNHARDFWSLVTAYCPQWRTRKKWLRENGALLTVHFTS